MRYDFIEIGTSDFETLLQESSGVGLSIEPLKFYLDNLPNKDNVMITESWYGNYDYRREIRPYIDGSYETRMEEDGWEWNGNCMIKEGMLYLWKRTITKGVKENKKYQKTV
jgi:hypothetical protein